MAERPQYMTPEGYRALTEELARLAQERPRVVQGVADAAAEGDRSENAEYIYGKKRLREIDRRMRHLAKIVDAAVVVDPRQDRGDVIFFGATVVLEDDAGNEVTYQLVGEHETDAARRRISYCSPVGSALMRKRVDDEVSVDTPSGRKQWVVIDVRYQ